MERLPSSQPGGEGWTSLFAGIKARVRRHPLWSGLVMVVVIMIALGDLWGLFTVEKPFLPTITAWVQGILENQDFALPTLSGEFLLLLARIALVAVALFFLGYIAYLVRTDPARKAEPSEVYVDDVRADFSGERPLVFVTVGNNAGTLAADVSLVMCIYTEKADASVTKAITIPPKKHKEVHHHTPFPVSQNDLDDGQRKMEVRGRLIYRNQETPYCYEYLPWDGARPARLPMFVPCGSDTGKHITVRVGQVIERDQAGRIHPVKGATTPKRSSSEFQKANSKTAKTDDNEHGETVQKIQNWVYSIQSYPAGQFNGMTGFMSTTVYEEIRKAGILSKTTIQHMAREPLLPYEAVTRSAQPMILNDLRRYARKLHCEDQITWDN